MSILPTSDLFPLVVKGVNFYVRNSVLRSDRGSQFIDAELKKPLYARPPKGLMSVLQKEMGGEVRMQVMSGNFARPFMDMPEVAGSGGTKSQCG